MDNAWKQRIEAARKQRGISRKRLAELAGMGHTSVRHIVVEAHTITLSSLERLAHALEVEPAWLAYGVDTERAEKK